MRKMMIGYTAACDYTHNCRIDKAKEVVATKTERTIGDAFRT